MGGPDTAQEGPETAQEAHGGTAFKRASSRGACSSIYWPLHAHCLFSCVTGSAAWQWPLFPFVARSPAPASLCSTAPCTQSIGKPSTEPRISYDVYAVDPPPFPCPPRLRGRAPPR